jgi:DNA-binding transcriptional LysR family regulator
MDIELMQIFYGWTMNEGQLKTLVWVVRLGGIGAAARHLHMTQPAITRRIQELERDLGAQVLRREGRNVVPTELAHTYVASAERILFEMALMRTSASGNAVVGTIRMGVAELIALTWFYRLHTRIEERYPNVRLEIEIDLSDRLVTKLKQNQTDIALLPGSVSVPGMIKTDLGACALEWMSPPKLLNSRGGRHFTPATLAHLPILTLPEESNAHKVMVDWFEKAGVKPSRIHCCNSVSAVAPLVRKGMGVSLLPYDLFKDDLQAGTMVILPVTPPIPKVSYVAVYSSNAVRSKTTELVILAEIAQLAREESWFLHNSAPDGQPPQA